jgi:hypothetical protein
LIEVLFIGGGKDGTLSKVPAKKTNRRIPDLVRFAASAPMPEMRDFCTRRQDSDLFHTEWYELQLVSFWGRSLWVYVSEGLLGSQQRDDFLKRSEVSQKLRDLVDIQEEPR